MCGLLFSYQPGVDAAALRRRALASAKLLAHRGPDDEGIEVQAPWLIGHRRLAILDLAASRQPMSDPGGRYWLAYNGETYNFRELRPALEARWDFHTDGDTEVVLAGLVCEGAAFLRRMQGMWALALWDGEASTLLLSRDPMGKKPLYYRQGGGAFACASELPALRPLGTGTWEEDPDSTADYFRYGYHLPGTTAYSGVREVLAGHALRWNPEGAMHEEPYWQLGIGGWEGTRQQAASRLRETFIRAVSRRLVADVEVGAFLSGGVDSSLVVGTLGEGLGVHPKTFTIGFAEGSFDERPHARRVAREFQTDHHERILERWDAQALVRLILDHVGQPFADSSLLPTSEVSSLAGEHVKVALSGDGGDELFSGYQRYQARVLLQWYSRLPRPLRANLERVVRALPEPMAHHSRSLLKKAHLFLDLVARDADSRPYVAPLMYSGAEFARLLPALNGRGHPPPALPRESRLDGVTEMMAGDALVYLPQDILVKVDRASMAHSLEARAPFLDRDLVELAFSLPRRWHRRGLRGKRLLEEAFPGLLPAEVWRRRKQGFAVPVHAWFRQGLGDELMDLLEETDSPLDRNRVRELNDAHRQGRRDHGYRLWAAYVYLLWRRHG